MTTDPRLPLARAVVALQTVAPEQFQQFLFQLGGYSEMQVERMLRAPVDALAHAQGRAKFSRELCEDLERSLQIVNNAEVAAQTAAVAQATPPPIPGMPVEPFDL